MSAPAAPARIRPRKLGWGDYRLELNGPDGAKTIVRFSVGWGAPANATESPDLVRVSPARKDYGQGDTVEIAVQGALRRRGAGGGRHRPADRLQDLRRSARTAARSA